MALDMPAVLDVVYRTGQRKDTDKFFLEAEVVRNELIPPYVFLFRRNLDGVDEFCSIAAVQDLECWPPNRPCDGSPFFLLDKVTLEFTTGKEMKEVLDQFRERLCQLVVDYHILIREVSSEFTETYNSEAK